jgi:hypothetical protein
MVGGGGRGRGETEVVAERRGDVCVVSTPPRYRLVVYCRQWHSRPQLRIRGCRGHRLVGSRIWWGGGGWLGGAAGAPPLPRVADGWWAGSKEAIASTSAEGKKETVSRRGRGAAVEEKKEPGGDTEKGGAVRKETGVVTSRMTGHGSIDYWAKR